MAKLSETVVYGTEDFDYYAAPALSGTVFHCTLVVVKAVFQNPSKLMPAMELDTSSSSSPAVALVTKAIVNSSRRWLAWSVILSATDR